MKNLLLLIILFYTHTSYASVSRAEYDTLLDRFQELYAEEIHERGGELDIMRLWDHDMVNASAYQENGTWKVKIMGGLARHELITLDGLTFVICHEFGHHLAGAPLFPERGPRAPWSAVEGQNDYFAAVSCLKRLWQNNDNQLALINTSVPEYVSEKCERVYRVSEEAWLCRRVAMAALPFMQTILASYPPARTSLPYPKLDFATPDPNSTAVTLIGHPNAQ